MTNVIVRRYLQNLLALAALLLLSGTGILAWLGIGFRVEAQVAVAAPRIEAEALPPASPTPGCVPSWEVVSSPNLGSVTNYLFDVAVVSSNDVWAVGSYYDDTGMVVRTLVEHWNGQEWQVVSSPNPHPQGNRLIGVDAVSPTDVWAVGYSGLGPWRTLTMHWDGQRWSVVPSPNAGTSSDNILYQVDAVSPTDVWAVGYYTTGGFPNTLTMHWDGQQWSVVPSPNPGPEANELHDVAVVSSTDVWAVGLYTVPAKRTLTMHWDGQQWSVVPSPNLFIEDNVLNSVVAISTNDVWAIGYYGNSSIKANDALMLHWDGQQWTHVPGPSIGARDHYLRAASALSSDDVWAVGYIITDTRDETLVLHWDGVSWTRSVSPSPAGFHNDLHGVAALSAQEVWGVGYSRGCFSGCPWETLTERYSGECLTPTPTTTSVPLTPTNTGTATATAMATSATTSTSTPTACAITFTDVPSNNTFYANIRCLACRGIVSGYSNGTFRPNNQVTRGQLAKIVSNSAGFSETPTQQTFEDVLPTNTFYEWIERLAIRGYMTGYNCGSPGEPCVSGKPYFRPFANATRGQTAKIVSNAAGFTEPPVGQTFEDVPSTHTFYEFIQRLATRNVMGGYPCGGPNEPCISGKPYFRPGNDVTRGQSSKIVANAFYPDCVTP